MTVRGSESSRPSHPDRSAQTPLPNQVREHRGGSRGTVDQSGDTRRARHRALAPLLPRRHGLADAGGEYGGRRLLPHRRHYVLALYKRELLAADANLSPEGSGFAGIGLAHNVATLVLVDAALEAAVAAGGSLLNPGTETEWAATPVTSPTPTAFLEPGERTAHRPTVAGSSQLPGKLPVASSRITHRLAVWPSGRLAVWPSGRLAVLKACTTEGRESLIPPFSSCCTFPLSEEKVTPSGWRAHIRFAKY